MLNIVSPESVGFSSDRLQRVNRFMQGYIDKGKLASGLTMLARGGEVFHFEPYGVLDLDGGAPVERDTIFRFYSMTKPITSVAVMMLYEDGRFSLDDPVGKFIPEFARHSRSSTVWARRACASSTKHQPHHNTPPADAHVGVELRAASGIHPLTRCTRAKQGSLRRRTATLQEK